MLAAIRPTDWNWLLLFHLLTAFVLVGGMIVVFAGLARAPAARGPSRCRSCARSPSARLWSCVIPMFVLIHVFGPMLADREYPRDEPGWLGRRSCSPTIGLIAGGRPGGAPVLGDPPPARGEAGGWPDGIVDWLPALLLLTSSRRSS